MFFGNKCSENELQRNCTKLQSVYSKESHHLKNMPFPQLTRGPLLFKKGCWINCSAILDCFIFPATWVPGQDELVSSRVSRSARHWQNVLHTPNSAPDQWARVTGCDSVVFRRYGDLVLCSWAGQSLWGNSGLFRKDKIAAGFRCAWCMGALGQGRWLLVDGVHFWGGKTLEEEELGRWNIYLPGKVCTHLVIWLGAVWCCILETENYLYLEGGHIYQAPQCSWKWRKEGHKFKLSCSTLVRPCVKIKK